MTVQLLKVIAFTAILGTFAASAIVPASAKDAASRQVTQRMALMASQKAALDVLTEMMAGRSRFDRSKARNARRQLVRSTGSIARHFRKARMAPRTRARVLIWQNWTDFKERAQTANTAARSLGHPLAASAAPDPARPDAKLPQLS